MQVILPQLVTYLAPESDGGLEVVEGGARTCPHASLSTWSVGRSRHVGNV
jgi:hypothetical protein